MSKNNSEDLKQRAKENYQNHQIVKSSEGRWLLQKRYEDDSGWESNFWTEIVSLHGGQLYVGGDIDHVIFAYYSAPEDIRGTSYEHLAKVRWMGKDTDFDYYIRQKATMGTGRQLIEVYDEELAEEYIRDYIKELKECIDASSEQQDRIDELEDLVDSSLEDEQHTMQELWRIDPDFAMDCGSFRVTAPRLYFAHAALARLCELLDAERIPEDFTVQTIKDEDAEFLAHVAPIPSCYDTLADAFGDEVYCRMQRGGGTECPFCGRWGTTIKTNTGATFKCSKCGNNALGVGVYTSKGGWLLVKVEYLIWRDKDRYFIPRAWNKPGPWVTHNDLKARYEKYLVAAEMKDEPV
jgi:hypothetical protein